MFHPERLTGKRRRKYLASINYAPPAAKIPKHLLKVIRAPVEHVKYIRMVMPKILGARTAHHVAVIRQRVVMLNHNKETQDGEKALAELSGTKDWRCSCYAACEMYATHTKLKQERDKRNRKLAQATAKADMPEDMIALRLKCRTPRTTHRTVYLDKNRGFDQQDGNTTFAPYVGPKYLHDKWHAAGLPEKIKQRAAEVLAAALGGNRSVDVNAYSADNPAGVCQLNVRVASFGAAWAVHLDPYGWFSRIYYRGLSVLGDWFVTNATRWDKAEQQDGVELIRREYNKTSMDLGVCQPATAVSLTWLRRPCGFSGGRSVDVVAGVIARPFPGASWFLPLPKWGSDAWSPRANSYHTVYKFENPGKTLAKPYTTAKARELAREYAATRLPPGVATECLWSKTLEMAADDDV
jgi:hypothetical protein